jgi:hypothetical protein
MNAPRALGGGRLQGQRIVRLVYEDEAGISAKEPYLVVAAVIVDADKQLIALERHLDKLVDRWIPESSRKDFIFHATDLFNGTNRGSGKPFERDHPDWPIEKRLEIADALAAIPKKFRLPLTTGWVEKSTFPATEPGITHWATRSVKERIVITHAAAFLACSLKIELWMRRNAPSEVCMLIVEDNDQSRSVLRETHNFHQQRNVADLLSMDARRYFPLRKIKEDPLFQTKRKSSVLQLADFCGYVAKKYLMGDERYDRFFNPMRDQFFDLFEVSSKKAVPS